MATEAEPPDLERGWQASVLFASLLPAALVVLLWWIGWESRIDDRYQPMASPWSLLAAVGISLTSIGVGLRLRRFGGAIAAAVGLLVPLGAGIALQLGGDVEYALRCRQYHECSDAQFLLLSLWGVWGSMTASSFLIGWRCTGLIEGARRLLLALASIAFGTYGGYAVGWWYGAIFGSVAGALVGLLVLFTPRGRRKQTDSVAA